MVQGSLWLQVHSSCLLSSCLWVSVSVTFSPSGDRKAPFLSYPEPIFNKAAEISQLELLFHKDLLGGADGKNGGYTAKKITLGCQSKFTLENTSSVQCFPFSSTSMLLKSRWHFKTRFWKSSKWVSRAPISFPSSLLYTETNLTVSTSPVKGSLFHPPWEIQGPTYQETRLPNVVLKPKFCMASPTWFLSLSHLDHTPTESDNWFCKNLGPIAWNQLPLDKPTTPPPHPPPARLPHQFPNSLACV